MTPAELAARVLSGPARLGGTRLVCVDGPSGAGKTTLADALSAALEERGATTTVVHMDDLYDGWTGLRSSGDLLHDRVLAPLSQGRPGVHPRYDWHRGEYGEERTVPVTDVLVVEGVGAWRGRHARLVTVLVWVDTPRDVRRGRAVRRDGSDLEPELLRWHRDEDALHRDEGTRAHVDVVVDGTLR